MSIFTSLQLFEFSAQTHVKEELLNTSLLFELLINQIVESVVESGNRDEESGFNNSQIILQFLDITRVEAIQLIKINLKLNI